MDMSLTDKHAKELQVKHAMRVPHRYEIAIEV